MSALNELTDIMADESNVSAFELHSSGLVQILLKLFATSGSAAVTANNYESRAAKKSAKLQRQRVEVFKKCFRDKMLKKASSDGKERWVTFGRTLDFCKAVKQESVVC